MLDFKRSIKMKNHKPFYIVLIPLLLSIFQSCEKFLEIPPENAVTVANFFQSESDFKQAITGIYTPLQTINDAGAYSDWNFSEMRSDNTHFIFNPAVRGALEAEHVPDFLVEPDNPGISTMYNNYYLMVARANQVLYTIDDADFDQDVKDNLKGQALCLRAFAYFKLVRYFGGVPLHLEPVTNLDGTILPRSPVADVYDRIIKDAGEAAQLLPGKADQETGRVSSGTAYTLLGDVYMTLGNYEDAESALNNVTGYDLVPVYADLFDPLNEGNEEMIFEVEYIEGTSLGLESGFPYSFLPQLEDPSVITGVTPSNPGGGGYNIPTPDIIAAFEDTVNDQRYTASIGYYSGPSNLSNITFNRIPYIKKYQHAHNLFGETGQNWPVYRYADVLLLLAEAVNEQGGRQAEAETYLNRVRNRAGLADTTATGQAELRDIIAHERRVELAFENKRWFDLIRTGKAVETMNNYGQRIKANPVDYYYLYPNTGPISAAYNVNENKLIYPLPFSETELDPDLGQNPR